MERILLFLSKTDKSVYNVCSPHAKNTQQAFGLFVLLTGLLAFCSGTFACSNLFTVYDTDSGNVLLEPNAWWYASGLGLFYACLIMAIDREVVAAKNKLAVIPRLILATVIGIVVAVPIELELLEGRIEKQIKKESSIEIQPLENKKDSLIQMIRIEKNSKEKPILEEIKQYQEKIDDNARKMQQEAAGDPGFGLTGKGGEGPAWRNARDNKLLYQGYKQAAETRLVNIQNDSTYQKRIDKIEENFNNYKNKNRPEFDLLSKFQTLNRIIENDTSNSTEYMSWGIRLLFILFEIIPSLIKLITPSTEYDKLIEARRRINTQMINTRSNDALIEMESNIDVLVKDKNNIPLPYMKQIKENIQV
jgi:hypothetical protein